MKGRLRGNPGCSKMEPLELDEAGKARKDRIRRRESREKKALWVERGAPNQTGNVLW